MAWGFDSGQVYGQLGVGKIHVHHTKPLAEIGDEYEVDPVSGVTVTSLFRSTPEPLTLNDVN